MTPARAKLASVHVLHSRWEDDCSTPRDDEPGPPQPALPCPYPWRDEEEAFPLTRSPAIQTNLENAKSQSPPMSKACAASSKARCCRGSKTGRRAIREQAFGEALDPDKLERLGHYESPSRPQARTNAHHAAAAQGAATDCRRGLIRFAKLRFIRPASLARRARSG